MVPFEHYALQNLLEVHLSYMNMGWKMLLHLSGSPSRSEPMELAKRHMRKRPHTDDLSCSGSLSDTSDSTRDRRSATPTHSLF